MINSLFYTMPAQLYIELDELAVPLCKQKKNKVLLGLTNKVQQERS